MRHDPRTPLEEDYRRNSRLDDRGTRMISLRRCTWNWQTKLGTCPSPFPTSHPLQPAHIHRCATVWWIASDDSVTKNQIFVIVRIHTLKTSNTLIWEAFWKQNSGITAASYKWTIRKTEFVLGQKRTTLICRHLLLHDILNLNHVK